MTSKTSTLGDGFEHPEPDGGEAADSDPVLEAIISEIGVDPMEWARQHGKVTDRVTREAVDFVPTALQGRMFQQYAHCQGRRAPCRMVVTKSRRGGGSTGASALMYLHAQQYRARLGAIGTDEAVSMNMLQMVKLFDKHSEHRNKHPLTKDLAKGFLEWEHGSSWEKYTAENPEAARSAGLQGYHATEVSRWHDGGAKDARETLKSMLGAVPRRGFTLIIEESTAQGAKGAFYDRFQSARWPTAAELGVAEGAEYWRVWAQETPQNLPAMESERALQYVRVFAAWFEDDENRPGDGVTEMERERIEATLDEAERELIKRYRSVGPQGERLGDVATRATLWEQLAWRRAVIATEFEGHVEAFQQENPASPHEAFTSSGRHTFNRAGCAYLMELSRSRVPETGVLDAQYGDRVVFRRTSVGEAWVHRWDEPRQGHRYIIGVDTCGGSSNSRNPDHTDYHAVLVLRAAYGDEDHRKHPHAVVASMYPKCQLDPDVLVEKVKLLSEHYGGCMVVFETNNTGAAFRQDAVRLGLYLYEEQYLDVKTSHTAHKVGWTTTRESRAQMMGTLKRYLRNNAKAEHRHEGVACWNPVVAQECTDLMPTPEGVDKAPGNKHDDHVMALGMVLQCVDAATLYAHQVRKRREPADRDRWTRTHGRN